MTSVTIISDISHETGWIPVLHMVNMFKHLTDAELHDISALNYSKIQKFIAVKKKRVRSGSDQGCVLCIAASAHSAKKFVHYMKQFRGFSRAYLWIIDSFWTEHTQDNAEILKKYFDHIIYTQNFDDAFYQGLFGERALCLPWGSDALDLGSHSPERKYDILRIGRQPPEWDDDDRTRLLCEQRGLRFSGRPARHSFSEQAVGELMRDFYAASKFILAHSNVAAPAPYTHPTKAYITARWTDALACGAVIAGVPPEEDIGLLDWPEALLRFPEIGLESGLDILAEAVSRWTPEIARRNHLEALKNLDWRWRFKTLADHIGLAFPALDRDVDRLEARIGALSV